MLFVMLFSYLPVTHAQIKQPGQGSGQLPEYSGVEDSIREYLCTPDMGGKDADILANCVGKLYRFGVAFGAIALVFFMVLAGYLYITGGESGKQKGKSVLLNALVGMALMLCSYLILSFINPDLTKFKSITPPSFIDPHLPNCKDVGYNEDCTTPDGGTYRPPGGGSGGKCSPLTSGPASESALKNSCFAQLGPDVPTQASIVAKNESGGDPSLPVGAGSCGAGKAQARCTGGEIPVWGLFQINITVHKVGGLNCPAAFNRGWTCSNTCTVVNQGLYNQCVAAAKNAANNINAACAIAKDCRASGKPTFCAWGNVPNEHGKKCGF